MMTDGDHGWREIHRTEHARDAQVVATAIAAMEFAVRARSLHSTQVLDDESDAPGPFLVEVREADAPALREVIDEIIDEQRSFDDSIDARDQRAFQGRRVAVLAFAIIIVILVALQLLRL